MQFLGGRSIGVLLDLDDLDAELCENELANVEVGAPFHQHFLIDEAGVPCIGAHDLHQLHQAPHSRSLGVHYSLIYIDKIYSPIHHPTS